MSYERNGENDYRCMDLRYSKEGVTALGIILPHKNLPIERPRFAEIFGE